ncbi:MAG: hypothetical protein RIT81_42070 [Deltaproteobacteria bacterium]
MIRYRVSLSEQRVVIVSLDSDDPDKHATIELEGHPSDVAQVRHMLDFSNGIDGRLIEERTTPVDLDVAMHGKWLRDYAERLEGEEILARYVRRPAL